MIRVVSRLLPHRVFNFLTAAYFRVSAVAQNGFGAMHSQPLSVPSKNIIVEVLPALSDNYMYLIIDTSTKEAAVVDPVNPDVILDAVSAKEVNLTKILTTHHHWDHAGGNLDLIQKSKKPLLVYGGDEGIQGLTNQVRHGDTFKIGNIDVRCLSTPCHTKGHVCYYLSAPDETPMVFTGDTLFISGCGRFFEGTAEQMYTALIDTLGKLPDETKVFCGHEYTLQNLKFAKHVEKHNSDITDKIAWAVQRRSENLPTVPSTIAEEKRINPFMRVNEENVQRHAGGADALETMRAIRKEKDNF